MFRRKKDRTMGNAYTIGAFLQGPLGRSVCIAQAPDLQPVLDFAIAYRCLGPDESIVVKDIGRASSTHRGGDWYPEQRFYFLRCGRKGMLAG